MKWYKTKEARFSFLFLSIFLASFVILYFVGLIPNELKEETGNGNVISQLEQNSIQSVAGDNGNAEPIITPVAETPLRIEADEIGLNFQVVNPTSQNNVTLDNALTEGAVHYPGSGFPGIGNMFIFGHSTGFKVVNNKAYQVFNNIHNLKSGDQIKVLTSTKTYFYTVTSVSLEKESDAYVSFTTKENMLTLSTCNSFGQKEDRYVVVASFSGSSPVQNS